MRIAVIGAGAAGLVTARELGRQGHDVSVFEQSGQVGGIWVYNPLAEDDPLGLHSDSVVFSSVYDSLRTNLPRDLMAFQDYTFDSMGGGNDTWQRYPHHSKVLEYLENFASEFDLLRIIRFRQSVSRVEKSADTWFITSRNDQSGDVDTQGFDAVAVCNGHYSKPRLAEIAGADTFSGTRMHSHNYRNPADFANKRVVLLGTAASGIDISREIATVSDQVYWCGHTFSEPSFDSRSGIHRYPAPVGFNGSTIHFPSALTLKNVDCFIYCTGYEYCFPFLKTNLIQVNDNWVSPLYRDVVVPADKTLAFIGLPFSVVPFPLFEIQAKWWANALSESRPWPSPTEMMREVEAKIDQQDIDRIERHHRHKLAEKQFDYFDQLAAECGEPPLADWFKLLAQESLQSHVANPETFRDAELIDRGPTVVTNSAKISGVRLANTR